MRQTDVLFSENNVVYCNFKQKFTKGEYSEK